MNKGFRQVLIAPFSILLLITITGPAAAADPAFLSKSSPVSISIPSLGVNARLIKVGLDKNGSMQVPKSGTFAAWYTGLASPGEMGPAIIVGHVNMFGRNGVFFGLKTMKRNDLISVLRSDGETVKFQVDSVKAFSKGAFPTQLVYGAIDYAGLRLITCGGVFDPKTGHYKSNIIVFARMVA